MITKAAKPRLHVSMGNITHRVRFLELKFTAQDEGLNPYYHPREFLDTPVIGTL